MMDAGGVGASGARWHLSAQRSVHSGVALHNVLALQQPVYDIVLFGFDAQRRQGVDQLVFLRRNAEGYRFALPALLPMGIKSYNF